MHVHDRRSGTTHPYQTLYYAWADWQGPKETAATHHLLHFFLSSHWNRSKDYGRHRSFRSVRSSEIEQKPWKFCLQRQIKRNSQLDMKKKTFITSLVQFPRSWLIILLESQIIFTGNCWTKRICNRKSSYRITLTIRPGPFIWYKTHLHII